MLGKNKKRLLGMAVATLIISASICLPAHAQVEATPRAELDGAQTRYNALNSSQQLDLAKLSRKSSLQQSINNTVLQQRGADWTKATSGMQRGSVDNVEIQDLVQHLPFALQTIQIVTTTANSHPQVVRVMRFLTRHVDPQF